MKNLTSVVRRVRWWLWLGCGFALPGSVVLAQVDETARLPWLWWTAPACAALALLFAYVFYRGMIRTGEGNELMRRIAGYVRQGADAYLRQQYRIVAIFFVIVSGLLAILAFALKVQSAWVPFAFLTGGFFSGLSGFIGMRSAVRAGGRTANAARTGLNDALRVAFRTGAIMGLVVVGLGLLDICGWFFVLYVLVPRLSFFEPLTVTEITVTMLCFGMGASSQALFARVGGGIFTKAADVGADLVGKVEKGIPEDDPRNPATIADNVGDNVGDVAGMGADLYESYCGAILASAALGVAAAATLSPDQLSALGGTATSAQLRFITLPMVISGIGILLSILGVYAVRTGREVSQRALLNALSRGVNLSSFLVLVLSLVAVRIILPGLGGIWGAIAIGLLVGMGIGKSTEFFTSDSYSPTRSIAQQSKTGPATVIIEGFSTGLLSTSIPVALVVLGMLLAYGLSGGFTSPILGLYGIGVSAVGMLSTLGITLATDAYGPVADNAGGNAQMSGLDPTVRERTDALDALGNTTAATGKGFAIGSAALTALALLAAYVEEVRAGIERMASHAQVAAGARVELGANLWAEIGPDGSRQAFFLVAGEKVRVATASVGQFMQYYSIHLMNPKVLAGLLLGGVTIFVFCALTMKAVGRAASRMVEEVRRQFREKPGIMAGTDEPDYGVCVGISTRGAQRAMVVPCILALLVPVVTGLLLGVAGVAGLLAGAMATGFLMAVMMANSGGAWDNAKKYIEKGNLGGKGSPQHAAGVVGDTVGDPFKDTSGPSLNIAIKLMSMVAVVFAGLTVRFGPIVGRFLGMLE